jgi:hypothetical protein
MPTLIISLRLPLEYHNRLLAWLPKICAGRTRHCRTGSVPRNFLDFGGNLADLIFDFHARLNFRSGVVENLECGEKRSVLQPVMCEVQPLLRQCQQTDPRSLVRRGARQFDTLFRCFYIPLFQVPTIVLRHHPTPCRLT